MEERKFKRTSQETIILNGIDWETINCPGLSGKHHRNRTIIVWMVNNSPNGPAHYVKIKQSLRLYPGLLLIALDSLVNWGMLHKIQNAEDAPIYLLSEDFKTRSGLYREVVT